MVKKFIGQSIMSKKLWVSEFSQGLEPVIVEAIARAIGGKVRQYIFENNCMEFIKANSIHFDDKLGPWWHVRCIIDFERLVLPTAVSSFEFCNDSRTSPANLSHHMATEFIVKPFVNGASYVHNGSLLDVKQDLTEQAILYVATHVHKLLLRKV